MPNTVIKIEETGPPVTKEEIDRAARELDLAIFGLILHRQRAEKAK
jgi:hypothetical protein